MRPLGTTVALALALTAATIARADDKKTYLPEEVKSTKVRYEGWDPSLVLGASSSFSQNSNVIGATEGTAWSVGFQLLGGLGYIRGQHEWVNALKLGETFTYTSAMGEFVKAADELSWKSTYLYTLRSVPWLGPFGEFRFQTSLFPSHDVQSSSVEYMVDGASRGPRTKLRLSDALTPVSLYEAIGAFGRPIDRKDVTLEIKLGFSAKHTFADGQLAVDDDKGTDGVIEVKTLSDVHQGGPAASLGVKGTLAGSRVVYGALAEAMVPVLNNRPDDDSRNAGELTNVLMEAGLSFKLFSWASLDYQFKALREPQLLDRWQVQNNLLLTFSLTLVKARTEEAKPQAK